jgi:hypothetical protein
MSQLHDPFLKISLGVRIAVFLGIVLLMAAKPGLWESFGILGISASLGLLLSLFAWHRNGRVAAPRVDLGRH